MNTVYRFTTLTLMLAAVLAGGFSQNAMAAAKAENLVRGVVGPVSSNSSWSGFSALSLFRSGSNSGNEHEYRFLPRIYGRYQSGHQQHGSLYDSAGQLNHQRGYPGSAWRRQ